MGRQAATPVRAPGLGTVFEEMHRDLWRFLSVETAIVPGAGGGATSCGWRRAPGHRQHH
jgi:hypothetical protein